MCHTYYKYYNYYHDHHRRHYHYYHCCPGSDDYDYYNDGDGDIVDDYCGCPLAVRPRA